MSNSDPNTQSSKKPRTVCCIGDVHGYITKLKNLWSNLETLIDPSDFNSALIIFLGDYCDRGPNTREVIDFLISLPTKFPNQKHVFLSGNHDLAFAAFVGVLPQPVDGSDFKEGWKEYDQNEPREGWFNGDGYERMHLQGRRWGGKITVRFNTVKGTEYKGSIYDAAPTFESYGVPHGSAGMVVICLLVYFFAVMMLCYLFYNMRSPEFLDDIIYIIICPNSLIGNYYFYL